MRVVTLHPRQFEEACLRLKNLCLGFNPDLVVCIPTGGEYVASAMRWEVPVVAVKRQRPSTKKKDKPLLKKLMRALPYPLLNLLRIAEAKHLSKKPKSPIAPAVLAPEVKEIIAKSQRILIVDDAVDSGATMLSVKNAVVAASPHAQVMSAAITVTTSAPAIIPQFCLYNNSTLIRFPWSIDYKRRKE